MRRLAKNLILATAIVSAIFFVDLEFAEAANFHHAQSCTTEKKYPPHADEISMIYLDFWSKFRDTVMPDEPQDNNPPKGAPPPSKSGQKKPPPHKKPPKSAN